MMASAHSDLPGDRTSDRSIPARIFLECGADEAPLEASRFEIGPCGMRMEVPWRFEPGTCLEIKIRTGSCGNVPQDLEVVVVSCSRMGTEPRYELILLFLDPHSLPAQECARPSAKTVA